MGEAAAAGPAPREMRDPRPRSTATVARLGGAGQLVGMSLAASGPWRGGHMRYPLALHALPTLSALQPSLDLAGTPCEGCQATNRPASRDSAFKKRKVAERDRGQILPVEPRGAPAERSSLATCALHSLPELVSSPAVTPFPWAPQATAWHTSALPVDPSFCPRPTPVSVEAAFRHHTRAPPAK